MTSKREENRKILEDKFKSELHDIYAGSLVLIGKYTTAISMTEVRCFSCGYTWETSPLVLRRGKGCPVCAGRRYTTEKLQEYLYTANKKIKLLSEYMGIKEKIKCMCEICSHEWEPTAEQAKTGNCPSCLKKVKGSIDKMSAMFNHFGHDVTILGDYKNNSTPIECLCNRCKEVFHPMYTSVVYNGSGCPFCAFKGRIPKGPAYLYYLRLQYNEVSYWKIGITTKQDILSRYPHRERKDMTLLYSYLFEDGRLAYQAEKDILIHFKQYQVPSDIQPLYSGNTELFTKDVLQMNHLDLMEV